MISVCEWEREGCEDREVMSTLKGQGCRRPGCDVVYQERAWSVMQSGESGSSWPLPHSPDCSEGPAGESWF